MNTDNMSLSALSRAGAVMNTVADQVEHRGCPAHAQILRRQADDIRGTLDVMLREEKKAVSPLDWTAIAKAAGRHGIRFPTNAALEAFLSEIASLSPAATPVSEAGGEPMDADEIKQRILGALYDYRDAGPEEGESWESWYYAAFDLAAEKITKLLASLSPVSEAANGPEYHERKDAELKRIAARLAELSPSEGLFCNGGDFVLEFRWTTDGELPDVTDPTPTRDEAVRAADLIRSRIGQEFDGEAHFSELEANIFIRLLLASAPAPASGGVDAVAWALKEHFGYSNDTTFTAREAGRQAANVVLAFAASLSPAATPVSEAGGGPVRPEDEAEHFIQAAIDSAPEPLRRLGEWLANKLDDDDWKTADRLITGAAVSCASLAAELDQAAGVISDQNAALAKPAGDVALIRNLVIPMVRERSREPGDAWHQAEQVLVTLSQSTSAGRG